MKIRKFGKLAAINIAVLLIGVVVLELIFGAWFKAPGLYMISMYREVDWTIQTDDKYPRPSPVTYQRDYYGLRGNFGSPADVNIVTLGGSTTDQRFVSEGETWSDVLGSCLRDKGYDARVANAGVTGQTTAGHINNYPLWLDHIPDLKPAYVVAAIGINDVVFDSKAGQRAVDDITLWTESARPHDRMKSIRRSIKMNSAIHRLYRIIRDNIEASRAGINDAASRPDHIAGDVPVAGVDLIRRELTEKTDETVRIGDAEYLRGDAEFAAVYAGVLDDYKNRVSLLARTISDRGSVPVLVTQSKGTYILRDGQINGDLGDYFQLHQFNKAMLEVCKAEGLFCIDAEQNLPTAPGDYYDIVHTTPQGSEKLGLYLCEAMQPVLP